MLRTGHASIEIAAAPEVVYALVADITRMGEWSPECVKASWLGVARAPALGCRFRGVSSWKRLRWARQCEVIAFEAGRELAFRTVPVGPIRNVTEWRYRFIATPTGTLATEDYVQTRASFALRVFQKVTGRNESVVAGMRETLARIKAAAEHPDANQPRREEADARAE
jgi:Polyketide cyclase / dehydrase and lipid transport